MIRREPGTYGGAHDPPKCERFGDKIMRSFNILERNRTQNRIPRLLLARYGLIGNALIDARCQAPM